MFLSALKPYNSVASAEINLMDVSWIPLVQKQEVKVNSEFNRWTAE